MQYELLYIVPAKFTDAEIAEIIKKVEAVIKKHGGTVKRHEDAGKLKFAYPIARIRYGNYVLAEFEAETGAPANIDKDLRLSLTNEVLRFTLAKSHPNVWGKALKLSSYVAPLSSDESIEPTPAANAPASSAPIMQQPVSGKQVSGADLDKKIDEALAEDAAKL